MMILRDIEYVFLCALSSYMSMDVLNELSCALGGMPLFFPSNN